MSNKIKTGLAGCGKVAAIHAAALTAISKSAFTAVCDSDEKRAREFASRYNVKAYTDVVEMVKKEKLDVVTICTPHPPAVNALKSGANVLIEKPLASSPEDCEIMISAANEAGKQIGVISQKRFYSPSMRLKKLLMMGKSESLHWGQFLCLAGAMRFTIRVIHGEEPGRVKADVSWSIRLPTS
jgi:predicted dehydrogenase